MAQAPIKAHPAIVMQANVPPHIQLHGVITKIVNLREQLINRKRAARNLDAYNIMCIQYCYDLRRWLNNVPRPTAANMVAWYLDNEVIIKAVIIKQQKAHYQGIINGLLANIKN